MKQEDNTQFGKRRGVNAINVFITGMLLLGPFLMGIGVNSLGNENPIRAYFAVYHGFSKTGDPKSFPATLWSLGFLFPFGGLFGSLLASYMAEKFGMKIPNFLFCALMLLGAIFKIISRYTHVSILFISRFFDGIAGSGFMVTAVLLMFELLPKKVVSIYKPLVQMSINCGILFLGIISLNGVVGFEWNFVHFGAVAWTIILIIVNMWCPESPRFVYTKTRDSNATKEILEKIRGDNYDIKEFEELKKEVMDNLEMRKMSILELLKTKSFRPALLSLAILNLSQQLCGINAIVAFAPALLVEAGFPSGDTGGTIIFALGVIGSMIFAPIIQNQKRKNLWLIGIVVQSICFSGLMICEYTDASSGLQIFWLCLYVFIFQIGPGPMVWFLSVEMFPSHATNAAQGIATCCNWFGNTLVYLIFPILLDKIGIQVIFIFIIIMFLILTFSVFYVVETHKKTPDQVLEEYSYRRTRKINITSNKDLKD